MRVGRTSTTLPGAGLAAFAHDPQDQARALLAKGTSRKEWRTDESAAGVTGATSAQSRGTAYAGAQESARKMILGRGA